MDGYRLTFKRFILVLRVYRWLKILTNEFFYVSTFFSTIFPCQYNWRRNQILPNFSLQFCSFRANDRNANKLENRETRRTVRFARFRIKILERR